MCNGNEGVLYASQSSWNDATLLDSSLDSPSLKSLILMQTMPECSRCILSPRIRTDYQTTLTRTPHIYIYIYIHIYIYIYTVSVQRLWLWNIRIYIYIWGISNNSVGVFDVRIFLYMPFKMCMRKLTHRAYIM